MIGTLEAEKTDYFVKGKASLYAPPCVVSMPEERMPSDFEMPKWMTRHGDLVFVRATEIKPIVLWVHVGRMILTPSTLEVFKQLLGSEYPDFKVTVDQGEDTCS